MKSPTFLLVALALTGLARADGVRMPAQLPAVFKTECAACHVAYPPGLLPAESWQRIMSGLDKHFGSDASLDAASVKSLTTWLVEHSGTGRRVRQAPPQDRITRSNWFVRQHDEVTAAVWKNPKVRSPAQCQACHVQAAQGDFDEDRVRMPR